MRIDYYLSLNSPWAHLGAARIEAIAARHGAELRPYVLDFRAVVFPASGGLPLPQRSPQRQAYRLQELRRWRTHLDIPIELSPTHWPFDETFAAHCVIGVRELVGDAKAVALAHRLLKAVWEEERDPADRATLAALIGEVGLKPEAVLPFGDEPRWAEQRREDSEAALARGVFGAPSYVVGDEVFWGQDRLEFVEREVSAAG